MVLDLIQLLLERVGRVDLLAAAQGKALFQVGGETGNAAGSIQAQLGEAGLGLREFAVAAGIGLMMHVAAQRGHEGAQLLAYFAEPADDINRGMAIFFQIEAPFFQIVHPHAPEGGRGWDPSSILLRSGGRLRLFHVILT